jgi:hypothetical protein
MSHSFAGALCIFAARESGRSGEPEGRLYGERFFLSAVIRSFSWNRSIDVCGVPTGLAPSLTLVAGTDVSRSRHPPHPSWMSGGRAVTP